MMTTEKRMVCVGELLDKKTILWDEALGFCGCVLVEDIENAATVDAVEVVHGEWIVCGDGDYVPFMCSHCGKTTAYQYKIMYGKYCPNCGAKMDGGGVGGGGSAV